MAVPNNGPLMAGVTWFLTSFSGGFLALRLYAKLSRRQKLWWDDNILILAWALLFIETVLMSAGVILGFGRHTVDISPQNRATIALGMSAGASISSFASTLSKISFGVTLLRLTSSYTRAFVWFIIVSLFMIMLPSAVLVWVNCKPMAKVWDSSLEGTCLTGNAVVIYGIFNAAYCTFADFAIALLPWKLIWGLSLHWKEKVGIGIAMSMGLLAGMCAIIKGIYLMELSQQDFFFNGKNVTIWTANETATAIVGASIPVLRVFFKETIDSYYSDQSNSCGNTDSAPFGSACNMPLGGYPNYVLQNRQHRSMDKWGSNRGMDSLASEDDSDDDLEYQVDENGRVFTVERIRGPQRKRSSTSTSGGSDQIRPISNSRISLDDTVSFREMMRMGNGSFHSVDRNENSFFNNNSSSSSSSSQQASTEEIDIVIDENSIMPPLPPPPPSPPPRKLTPRPLPGPNPPPHIGTGIWTTRTASVELERNGSPEIGLAI